MQKSYIWSLPTRVFHGLFVLFILAAFITGDEDRLLNYHAIIGYSLLILLAFRIIWGLIGPKHSRFKDFPIGIENAKEFLSNIFQKDQKYIGHNPMASYVMIGMFIICFIVIVTGIFAFGIQEGKGLLSSLNSSFFKEMELFEETHEFFSGLFIAFIAAHVLGVLSDRVLHKKYETLSSIFTGYKVSKNNEGIKLNIAQKLFSFIMILVFIGFLVFNLYQPKNILIASSYTPINYEIQNELFVTECASCHTLYPSQSLA